MSTRLSDAATYSLMAGGKRLRPALVMATAEMLRVALENVRGFALAVEYIHTSSLIHDDLPAMDDDSMRRGQPACHVKYGEAAA
ncbi:MAG TPA: polyprenyl synthetase family protein, partial [Oligoflexia bacterium]|nr:polyprenyl synthetase family protein [Oligoflexia bacterium]